MSSNDPPSFTKSCSKLALPGTARPTRQVRPMMAPFRLRIALIRCSVRLIPARLSAPKSPTWEVAWRRSSKEMGLCERRKSPEGKRASGGRPRSMTTSTSAGSSGCPSTRRLSSPGSNSSSLRISSSGPSPPPRAARGGAPNRRRRPTERRGQTAIRRGAAERNP
jgi:hypothetical protein